MCFYTCIPVCIHFRNYIGSQIKLEKMKCISSLSFRVHPPYDPNLGPSFLPLICNWFFLLPTSLLHNQFFTEPSVYSFLNSSLLILFPCLNAFRGSQHLSGIHWRCLGVAYKAGLDGSCCFCLYSLVQPCLTESHAASWLLPSPKNNLLSLKTYLRFQLRVTFPDGPRYSSLPFFGGDLMGCTSLVG